MTEEKGSDELLGSEAIDQEKERAIKEEIALAEEEEITENAPKGDDGDTEYDDIDVAPPLEEEHPQYDTLPPPEEEI